MAPQPHDLRDLFHEPSMFDSEHDWRRAGFEVKGTGEKSSVMVASHPSVPGYLFKKYNCHVSPKEQLRNYRRRIKGAEKLRKFVASKHLTQIVVPQKYLHELPPEFSRRGKRSFVLVVERLDLLDAVSTKQLYRAVSKKTLRQLCEVLRAFRGLDSGTRNVPFTSRGQIAFVDTERWDEKREKKIPLRRIRKYLSKERRRLVETIFKR